MTAVGGATPNEWGHHPCGNIAPLFWQAMRGAVATPLPSSIAAGITDEEMAEHLPLLWDAVWQAAAGREPKLDPCPPQVHARHLLDNVRRSFLELIRSVDEHVAIREVVRVLDAIEQVQRAVDRDAIQSLRQQAAGLSGMDLLIEVAHDLRSPLTSILFLAETMRAGRTPLDPTRERQLKLIYSAAFELSSLANDLTELAQGGDRLLEREPVEFSIDALMHSVSDIVQPIAEEKGLEVKLSPAGAQHRIGHPAALGRVMLNLVTNALRCTDVGFVEVKAEDLSPTRVEFSVRDSGPGVPKEVVDSLFQPFDPLKLARARSFSSSGLGLAICRRLVAAMGGDLRVKSARERGSCFYFQLELPAKPSEASELDPVHKAEGGCEGFIEEQVSDADRPLDLERPATAVLADVPEPVGATARAAASARSNGAIQAVTDGANPPIAGSAS
jgi:signal transduction histidine kinase